MCPARKNGWVIAACALSLLCGEAGQGLCAARAQDPETSTAQPVETDACLQDPKCADLYESARTLSQAGQYEAALVAYQSAYARSKALWLLVNAGRMQQKAGRPQQAAATYKRLLAEPELQKDAETQSKAREYLRQAEQESEAQRLPLVTPPPAQSAAAPAPRPATPVYKKWWIWTLIGGATAAAAVGLGVGLGTRSGTETSVPPEVGVYEPRF